MVRRILHQLGASEALIEHVRDRPAHDRRYALADASTQAALNWAPQIRFEQGLAETLRWYAQNTAWSRAVAGPDLRNFLARNYAGRLAVPSLGGAPAGGG